MKKNYEPKGIEKKIYDKWESSGYFTAIPDEKKGTILHHDSSSKCDRNFAHGSWLSKHSYGFPD